MTVTNARLPFPFTVLSFTLIAILAQIAGCPQPQMIDYAVLDAETAVAGERAFAPELEGRRPPYGPSEPGEGEEIDSRPIKAFAASGRIVDPAGIPLAGIIVRADYFEPVATDADGRFTVHVAEELQSVIEPLDVRYTFVPQAVVHLPGEPPPALFFVATPVPPSGNNRTPTAAGQTVGTPAGVPKKIVLIGSDDDNDPLTFIILTVPGNGVLWDNSAGRFISSDMLPHALSGNVNAVWYVGDQGFDGIDRFKFAVTDGFATSDSAEVLIRVNAHEPPDDTDDGAVPLPPPTPSDP